MLRKGLVVFGLCLLMAAAGCKGMRTSGNSFTTHAESFRIIGIAIPEDDQAAAMSLVPAGATVTNVSSTPADWSSFWGAIFSIVGFHWTSVGGTR